MQVSKNLDYVCQIDTYLYEKRVGFLLPAVKAWLVEICGWWTESDWFHRTQCWFCGYTFPHFHELCESLQPRRGLLRPLWAYVHITLDTIAEMQTYVNYCLCSKIYYGITSFFRCARLSRFSSCFLSAFTIFPSRFSAFIWRPREGVVSDWDTSSELSSNPVWPPSSSKSESVSDLWSISSLKIKEFDTKYSWENCNCDTPDPEYFWRDPCLRQH